MKRFNQTELREMGQCELAELHWVRSAKINYGYDAVNTPAASTELDNIEMELSARDPDNY